MKLTINRNVWHYKVAHNGNFDKYGDARSGDLCGYFWGFVWGCVWPLLVVFFGSVSAGVLVLIPLIGVAAFLLEGLAINGLPGVVLVIEGLVVMVVTAAYLLIADESPLKRTMAMRLARAGYRGWKEKTCVLVEIN